jgi:hypothetical protein
MPTDTKSLAALLADTAHAKVIAALAPCPCIECGAAHCEATAACEAECCNDHIELAMAAADECDDHRSWAVLADARNETFRAAMRKARADRRKADELIEALRSGDAFGFARAAVGGAK